MAVNLPLPLAENLKPVAGVELGWAEAGVRKANRKDVLVVRVAEGSTVAGSSDAEVLLRAWARWGPAVLRDLDGFWAFVVYDKARRKLFLVRDQFGVPLAGNLRSTIVGDLEVARDPRLRHAP